MPADDPSRKTQAKEGSDLLYTELIAEAQALGGASLDHDADEARFRAALIAGLTTSRDLSGIAALADDLAQRLTQRRDLLAVGVGASYERLSRALDRLLTNCRSTTNCSMSVSRFPTPRPNPTATLIRLAQLGR